MCLGRLTIEGVGAGKSRGYRQEAGIAWRKTTLATMWHDLGPRGKIALHIIRTAIARKA